MKPKLRERHVTINKRNDGDKETYSASLSSDLPVNRGAYIEVLEHSESAINMERADSGLVLLFNHDMDKPIGRVSDVGLRGDNKLSGDFVFSDSDDGRRIKSMVDEGTLTDISIRYSIDRERRDENEGGQVTYTATRWTPLEASVVSIPADHTVGIGRQFNTDEKGETTMSEATPKGEKGNAESVVNFDSARKAGQSEGVLRERQRQADIEGLFAESRYQGESYQALKRTLLDDGSTVDQAMRKLLSHHGNELDDGYTAPQPKTERGAEQSTVRITEAAEDKTMRAMMDATDVRFKVGTEAERAEKAKGNQFAGASLVDLARESLRLQGVGDVYRFSAHDAVGYALDPRALPYGAARNQIGHGTSVFANITENIANKQLQVGFSEAAETWRQWCRVGSVSSFRQESRPDMNVFSDLDEVPENSEYTHGTTSDRKEYIQAKKYGKLFGLTREVIVNDDVNALSRALQLLGRSAERKTGDLVYAVLTGGLSTVTLSDGNALFNARASSTGTNIAATAGAPSVSTLDNMKTLMATMTDFDGNAVGSGNRIAYVLVPVALETTAMVLQNATNDPTSNAATSGDANTGGMKPNPFQGTFQTIADARLDAASTTRWYTAANPSLVDTIEVAYLNGQQSPTLESENGFTVDGITYKVRLEVGVKALSPYGLQTNAGV